MDNALIQNLEVVTHMQKNKDSSNKNLVEQFCLEKNITLHYPVGRGGDFSVKDEWDYFIQSKMFKGQSNFNLGIICSFGYMIPNALIDKFEHGMIVIHPSLLPKYRGASPIYHTLLNGDKQSGVSFVEISKDKFDAGNILLQKKIEIPSHYNYQLLYENLSQVASEQIVDLIQNLQNLKLKSQKQDEQNVSKAPKINQEDTYLNFQTESAQRIVNKVKAYNGSNFSAARAKFNDNVIFIENMIIPSEMELIYLLEFENALPGSIWLLKKKQFHNYVYIKCKNGWVKLIQWRPLNKRTRESYQFIHQYKLENDKNTKNIGTIFMQLN